MVAILTESAVKVNSSIFPTLVGKANSVFKKCTPDSSNTKLELEDNTKPKLEEVFTTKSSVVSDDNLTYQEVMDALLGMLGDSAPLLKEVMLLATILVRMGVKIAPESRLTKRRLKKQERERKDRKSKDGGAKTSIVKTMGSRGVGR